jgi:hypothetical protein
LGQPNSNSLFLLPNLILSFFHLLLLFLIDASPFLRLGVVAGFSLSFCWDAPEAYML